MDINQETIVKCLQQTASVIEQEKLEQWLNEKPTHKAYFNQIESIWNNADCNAAESNVNVNEAWDCISAKISSAETNKIIPIWEQSWLRLAASIVLAVGIGLGAFYFGQDTSLEKIALIEATSTDVSKEIQLPDGSIVTLMPYSAISYASDFIDERKEKLSGGAYFEVQKTKDQSFEVAVDQLEVTVLGTKFLIKESDQSTEVFVEEGSVSVSPNTTNSMLVLEADEGAYLDHSSKEMKPIVSIDNMLSWKSGVLEFNNVQLTRVVEDIEKHYNVSIKLKNRDLEKCHLTSKFDNKSIDEVLQVLELVLNVEIGQSNPNEYLISGKGC